MATAEPTLGPGDPFWLLVPAHLKIEQVRQFAQEKFGFAPHFRAQIGPTVIEEAGITTPITAVDDEILLGQMKFPVPDENHFILLGYLKD